MAYNIEQFNINERTAYLSGVDISLDANKDSQQPASCKSVNDKFTEIESYKKTDLLPLFVDDYIMKYSKKYILTKKVIKDCLIKLAENDSNRYQITLLVKTETQKVIHIYTEDETGKFKDLVSSEYYQEDVIEDAYRKINLSNGTIIYLYIDWFALTENTNNTTIGAFSNDCIYKEHPGFILNIHFKDSLVKDEENIENLNICIQGVRPNILDTPITPIDINKLYSVTSSILDLSIIDKSTDSDSSDYYLVYLLNGNSDTYWSLNISKYNNTEQIGIWVFDFGKQTGVSYCEKTIGNITLKTIIDWDSLHEKTYSLGGDANYKINRTYINSNRMGLIDLYQNKSTHNLNDQMYIQNNKVVCNNFPIGYNGSTPVIAKYAEIDLGSNAIKFMVKFTTSGGSICLAITNLHTNKRIENITNGSIHTVWGISGVRYGVYDYQRLGGWKVNGDDGNGNQINYYIPYNSELILDDNTEYEIGFEILNDNNIKIYNPDNTTYEVFIEVNSTRNLKDYIGRYAIFEHYCEGISEGSNSNFNRPSFTSVYCSCVDGISFKDNFKRNDGSLLVSPSGHIYTLYRNISSDNTIYDNSN